ncbi:MAG: zinc ribbon domain-containing protein [Nitrospirae bacterium]|nr:zinc ribbon domain-containing protein [Nitrospirota bacterium]
MAEVKVVVRERSGKMIKGTTGDFVPSRAVFHVSVGGGASTEVKEIIVDNLKAVFFVKSLEGRPDAHLSRPGLPKRLPPVPGKKIRVIFFDGEEIRGFSNSFRLNRPGFFLTPADPLSNNERVFVVFSAIAELEVDNKIIDLEAARLMLQRKCSTCNRDMSAGWLFCPYDGSKLRR